MDKQSYGNLSASEDITTFLTSQASFLDHAAPDDYARARLDGFTKDDLRDLIGDFRVVVSGGQMQAGCYLYEGGWLQDVFFEDDASLRLLATGLQAENVPHAVHFGPYHPKHRAVMQRVFETLKYVRDDAYHMHYPLIQAATVQATSATIHWTQTDDTTFEALYRKLTAYHFP